MSEIGSRAQQILAEDVTDALHEHQCSALVISDLLPLETIAGLKVVKRPFCVLEIGISLPEREVQYDSLLVGKPVVAGLQLFQAGQTPVAVHEWPDGGVVVLNANAVGRDIDGGFVGARRFVNTTGDRQRRSKTSQSRHVTWLDGERRPIAHDGAI